MAILTDFNITPGSTTGTLSKIVGSEYLPPCPPATIGAWVYVDPAAPTPLLPGNSNGIIAGIGRNSTNRGMGLGFRNSSGNVGYTIVHWNGTSARFQPFTSAAVAPYGNWHYVCGSLDNTGITACWINEARIYSSYTDAFYTNTGVANMDTGAAPWDRISLMALRMQTIINVMPNNVAIAEAAYWNVRLSDEEIRSLGKGIKATQIRPESLVEYIPAIRTNTGGLTGTSVNTTVIGQSLDRSGTYVPVNFKHSRRYG